MPSQEDRQRVPCMSTQHRMKRWALETDLFLTFHALNLLVGYSLIWLLELKVPSLYSREERPIHAKLRLNPLGGSTSCTCQS